MDFFPQPNKHPTLSQKVPNSKLSNISWTLASSRTLFYYQQHHSRLTLSLRIHQLQTTSKEKWWNLLGLFSSEALESSRKICCLLLFFLLLSSTHMQLIRCAFDKRECQQQQFLWQKGFFEKQVLPTHFLTRDHLLQHLHVLAIDVIIPEEYSCLSLKTVLRTVF